MPEEAPLLRGEGIHKTYGERVVTDALRGIDLELEHGAFCALTGPSGSGKTTLLNILGLLDRPSRGRVVLQGRDTGPLGDDERTRIRAESLGFIFQFHHLLMAFTALENVMMPMLSRRGRPRGWIRERAAHLLDRVGLSDRAHYRASDLSGGQQQRVAVARALVMEPALVLADEPTGNLDTESGDVVFEMLRDVARTQGTAFLIVTHDEGIAARCDRIVHMVDGRVASDTATPAS